MSKKEKPLEILVIDDDPVDRGLLGRAFKEVGANVSLSFSENGSAAYDLLADRAGSGPCAPAVCVCDINMPGMSGIDLLEKLKSDKLLRHIPVVMLSSSDNDNDVRNCYSLQAAGYICKPNKFADLCQFASNFSQYWASMVCLPQKSKLEIAKPRT